LRCLRSEASRLKLDTYLANALVREFPALERQQTEPVYEKLHEDIKGKIGIIRNYDIEKVQAAADKVIKAHDATVEIADDALDPIDTILGDDD